jgi:hypothetical protein
LDLDKLIGELKREREKIGRAIAALLEGTGLNAKGPTRKVARKRRSSITTSASAAAWRRFMASGLDARAAIWYKWGAD